MARVGMFAVLISSLAGCFTVLTTRPVEVVVTDHATGRPVPNVPVSLGGYRSTMAGQVPEPARGKTDADGRVVLGSANYNGGPTRVEVGGDTFTLDSKAGGVEARFVPSSAGQSPKMSVQFVPVAGRSGSRGQP